MNRCPPASKAKVQGSRETSLELSSSASSELLTFAKANTFPSQERSSSSLVKVSSRMNMNVKGGDDKLVFVEQMPG